MLTTLGWVVRMATAGTLAEDRFAVRHWSIEDGLPQTSITGIDQTPDGYLWLSTFGGIARFDGARFTVFDPTHHPALAPNRFVGVALADDGSLWFGVEEGGFVRYAEGVFTPVPTPVPLGNPSGTGPYRDGGGRLWAVAGPELVEVRDGVPHVDHDAAAAVGTPMRVALDGARNLWLLGPERLACWSPECEAPREARAPDEASFHLLSTGVRGRWNSWWPTPADACPAWAPVDWTPVLRWRDRLWCGHAGGLRANDAAVRLRRADDGHPMRAQVSFVDREGSLWLGTIGDGLYQVRDRELARFGREQGLRGTSTWHLVEDAGGRVWIGDDEHIQWLEGGRVVPSPPELDRLGHLRAVVSRGDEVWIVSDGGFYRWHEQLVREEFPIPPREVDAIFFDSAGATWLGGQQLLRIAADGSLTRWDGGVLGAPVGVIREGAGRIWVGTKKGVVVIDGDRATRHPLGSSVRDLLVEEDGTAWAGTYGGGIARVRDTEVRRLGTEDGLCENVISRMILEQGEVWMNGNRGVSRVALDELRLAAAGGHAGVRCDLFDSGEGNGAAGLRTRAGALWFPTTTGVVRIEPAGILPPVAPLTRIEEARVDETSVLEGQKPPPGRGDLVVRYAAMGLVRSDALVFRHRVVGVDEEWVQAGAERIARYVNLDPGDYRFEVQAHNPRGSWSEVAALAFSVQPHFYETRGFAGLVLVALSLGGWWVVQARSAAAARASALRQAALNERQRQELAVSEARLRLILESSADGLLGLDELGRISFANPAACAVLGRTSPDLVGHPFDEVIEHAPAEGCTWPEGNPVLAALRAGEALRRDGDRFRRADGEVFPVALAMAPLRREGRVVGAVLSFRDIGERVAAERAQLEGKQAAERLARARSEFVANMSHEIRTPLSAVLGLAQVGARHAPGKREQRAFRGILEAGRHLLGVVDDVLDFSKIEAGKLRLEPQPAMVGAIIDRAVDLTATMAAERGLELSLDEAPDLPLQFLVDPLRLSQVLLNLLTNAVKFTKTGGIRVEARREQDDGIGDCLVLAVSDSGIGMAPADVERVFSAFEQADSSSTRRAGGTGLGLAISRALVDQMGGRIEVESTLHVGSRFTVRVPLREVVEAGPASGAVALLDVDFAEPLRARGLRLVAPDAAELVIVSERALQRTEPRRQVRALVEAGVPVAVVERPGSEGPPISLRDRVQELVEPLRARHVVAALVAPAVRVVGAEARLSRRRVLVAEDTDVNRAVLEDLLVAEGAAVLAVADGLQALDQVRARPGWWEIVLMDIQMPEMDGYEATRRVAEVDPTLPVVGVTAHTTPAERERCFEAGMVAHLAKPFTPDELVALVLQHAREPAAEPELHWSELEARYPGRAEFVNRLLHLAVRSNDQTSRELREQVGAGDFDAVAVLAHGIKGTSGNLAAPALMGLAARVETLARSHSPEALPLARELADRFEHLLAEVQAHLALRS